MKISRSTGFLSAGMRYVLVFVVCVIPLCADQSQGYLLGSHQSKNLGTLNEREKEFITHVKESIAKAERGISKLPLEVLALVIQIFCRNLNFVVTFLAFTTISLF